jgi:hypothetical protein
VFVIGGHNIPRGVLRAGCAEAVGVSVLEIVPPFAHGGVGRAEFPVLVRVINAREKTLPLFLLREMEEELDDITCRIAPSLPAVSMP